MHRYRVELAELSAMPLAVVRRTVRATELAKVVPECCGLVWNVVRGQGAPGGRHVAVYRDDAIRVDVGVELLGPFTEQDDVVRGATPAGLIASTTHLGPYGGLGAAHEAIRSWCAANGHRLAGARWEIYGHWEAAWHADPSRIRTDVFYLIATP